MRSGYFTAACRLGLLAGFATLAACGGPDVATGSRKGVRIEAGAYAAAAGTRVEYESDGTGHRVVWAEGDALRVAAFADGARVRSGDKAWSRFDMVTEGGFDPSYMLFGGDALLPAEGNVSRQRLYGLYPAGMLSVDTDDALVFPAVQRYRAESFDTDAVLLVAAPVEATIPQEGTVRAEPFRFDHYTGYLRLSPRDLPADIGDEPISRIVLECMDDTPVAGDFRVSIDDAAGGWALEPGADAVRSVTLDCSEEAPRVGELEHCWFALLPGRYDRVALTLHTEAGTVVRMERSGLEIASGVVKLQDIRFRAGDTVSRTYRLDGGDLGIRDYVNGEVLTGTKNGVEFGFLKLRYLLSGEDTCLELGKRGGRLWNTEPLPGRVTAVEVECVEAYNARFVQASIGSSTETYEYTRMGNTGELNRFEPPAGSDFRYVSIENTGASAVAVVRCIRIVCTQGE